MKLSEFVPLPGSGVRVPASGAVPAGYLDGAERALLQMLSTVADRSVASAELEPLMVNWATRYHLTPYRSTLFDCLGFDRARDARVLELGAGCGAITRWLGEHCGEVDAVEGNPERARVIQARTADLDNISVYSANYSQLTEQNNYDIVTLIGVLEYGHLYHPDTRDPHEAALANLNVAHTALRDDSVLVLAIENKLGLKYFAGAREDHSAKPYDSIEGYPSTGNAVCFSARELEQLLAAAGFSHSAFFVPFPDYKLATTIVNPEQATDEDFVHGWLQGPAPDRGFPERAIVAFNETLAQREIVRAGLMRDLANSFLVLAYRGDVAAADERLGLRRDWIARHYSLGRRPVFRKRVTLHAGADVVVHEPAHGVSDPGPTVLGGFEHRFGEEPIQRGELALVEVLRTVAHEGLNERFVEHVQELARRLVTLFGIGERDESRTELLDGSAVDAVWWNLVVGPDGEWHAIDREWRFRGVLPLDYIVWRNLVHLFYRFTEYIPAAWKRDDVAVLATSILHRAGFSDDPARAALHTDLESAFGFTALDGEVPDVPEVAQGLLDEVRAQHFRVLARAEEVVARPELLRAYADVFGSSARSTLILQPKRPASEVIGGLREAIAHAGLDEATMPDTLLIDASDPVAVQAVLSDEPAWGPPGIPCFSGGELAALREFAEERWTASAA